MIFEQNLVVYNLNMEIYRTTNYDKRLCFKLRKCYRNITNVELSLLSFHKTSTNEKIEVSKILNQDHVYCTQRICGPRKYCK